MKVVEPGLVESLNLASLAFAKRCGFDEETKFHYVKNSGGTCRTLQLRRVSTFSEWYTIWPMIGVRHPEIVDMRKLIKKTERAPFTTIQVFLGRLMKGSNRAFAHKFSCFPRAEWEIRSEKEIEPKVEKMFSAINQFSWEFYERASTLDYVAHYDVYTLNDNGHDFYKNQIIAAYLIGDRARVSTLTADYACYNRVDEVWLAAWKSFYIGHAAQER